MYNNNNHYLTSEWNINLLTLTAHLTFHVSTVCDTIIFFLLFLSVSHIVTNVIVFRFGTIAFFMRSSPEVCWPYFMTAYETVFFFLFHNTYKIIKFSYCIILELDSAPARLNCIPLYGIWHTAYYFLRSTLHESGLFSSHFSKLIYSSKNEMYSLNKAWIVLMYCLRYENIKL